MDTKISNQSLNLDDAIVGNLTQVIVCPYCSSRWTAIYYEGTFLLECGVCNRMVPEDREERNRLRNLLPRYGTA